MRITKLRSYLAILATLISFVFGATLLSLSNPFAVPVFAAQGKALFVASDYTYNLFGWHATEDGFAAHGTAGNAKMIKVPLTMRDGVNDVFCPVILQACGCLVCKLFPSLPAGVNRRENYCSFTRVDLPGRDVDRNHRRFQHHQRRSHRRWRRKNVRNPRIVSHGGGQTADRRKP